jgi:hypothetical protein
MIIFSGGFKTEDRKIGMCAVLEECSYIKEHNFNLLTMLSCCTRRADNHR